eukprot:scaffold19236_cov24-Tisochrysis_lutea.AAC.2
MERGGTGELPHGAGRDDKHALTQHWWGTAMTFRAAQRLAPSEASAPTYRLMQNLRQCPRPLT